ncbi:unnamed protein product [Triticum turgidum subsp. durum]|uniref:Nuclear condensin complex subunit 3 C-terminal domain-containing protein n=1 Tax=Triticum turgidum subsp. durum TaxID=4567 RepID=A0A9R0ZA84_TRITD|nr:unnamed protein product [Triticum turgidum subsp. durum]
MQLPDDAEVSDEIWDEVIDAMKIRVQDKIPAIRVFAVRALSRFAIDEEDGGIIDIFLETLEKEQNAVCQINSVPLIFILDSLLLHLMEALFDLRRSIKQRTTLLHRGLSDRSTSVKSECLRMLKEEWLVKHCGGDVIALLRFLDVETYELVGESVMGVLLKDGSVRVQDGQTIRQYFTANTEDAEQVSSIKLMEAEVALYWKVMCMHLQAEAQVKGSEAATTTGTEAAVYASEASDKNDLLDGVLPSTVAEFVDLVKAHLSAGPNYHFASRQLLLLGGMLDFSDSMNRKVASSFLYELLNRPLEHEVDEDGNQIAIGDGVSLGGDLQWAKAVLELAKKVHASIGEFEMVIATVVEELARPCRERTADFMQWMHCLAVTGLLLENTSTLRSLEGTAIRPSEVLQSLLLPAAKQKHVDIQRAALRCLCLFGLLENKPSTELVKQLRLSFINGPDLVSAMASKALIDLVSWHGPQELDQAIGTEPSDANYEKTQFAPVDISDLNDDDLNVGVLSILFSGFHKDDWEFSPEGDNHDNVLTILGEGFAKILLLSENYPSISADLHPVILAQLRCVSSAFVPLMRAMWPGIHGNAGGSGPVVSKKRKQAVQAARFMVQMVQSPLFSTETAEQACMSPESLSSSPGPFVNYDISEEGLAIRIAVEVGNSQDKKSAPVKAYALALCKVAVLLRFRQSEQKAIKCMRGLVNTLAASAASDKDLMKELAQMASRLKSLDESPEEELPQDQADAIFEQLGLAGGVKLDAANTVVPPTPAPPRVATARAQRASKTAALSKFKSSVKPSLEAASDSEQDEMSGLTTDEDPSDDSDDPDEESS